LDWLQLLASIVDSLAWPVTIGIAAYLLRRPLLELLPNLRLFKFKEFEIQFGERLERLEQELGQEPPPIPKEPRSDWELIADERFDALAAISPNAAILEAWVDIESTLQELARHRFLRANMERRPRSALQIIRELGSRQIISPKLASMLDDLRGLRNVAAHPTADKQISLSEARRYKDIVDQVRDELQLLLE
jgi:hypothetical protein